MHRPCPRTQKPRHKERLHLVTESTWLAGVTDGVREHDASASCMERKRVGARAESTPGTLTNLQGRTQAPVPPPPQHHPQHNHPRHPQHNHPRWYRAVQLTLSRRGHCRG